MIKIFIILVLVTSAVFGDNVESQEGKEDDAIVIPAKQTPLSDADTAPIVFQPETSPPDEPQDDEAIVIPAKQTQNPNEVPSAPLTPAKPLIASSPELLALQRNIIFKLNTEGVMWQSPTESEGAIPAFKPKIVAHSNLIKTNVIAAQSKQFPTMVEKIQTPQVVIPAKVPTRNVFAKISPNNFIGYPGGYQNNLNGYVFLSYPNQYNYPYYYGNQGINWGF